MTFRAAGATDVGAQRLVNEDRFHADPARGIFVVIDGVGGQAAGGRAADAALDVIRTQLTHANGPVPERLRRAITAANNEIHRQAASRSEWEGMACVLTAVVVDGNRAFVGHVGDTRLYKLRGATIQKITADHSPIGEREDAGEISEVEAMRHPRRNEVYRDVGSDPHDAADADFVDVADTPFEPDAALLLCSDGLSDLVASSAIQQVVLDEAGKPDRVTQELIKAANEAGGKDNITVIYVEGEAFPAAARKARHQIQAHPGASVEAERRGIGRGVIALLVSLIVLVAAGLLWRSAGYPLPDRVISALKLNPAAATAIVVKAGESIGGALAQAPAGATILVEPGEYRERLTLRSDIRIVSLASRAATLRLPASASDDDAAILAADVTNAEIAGFRIVGDAATPLGVGVLTRSSGVRLIDLEVSGAARTAVDLGQGDGVMLLGSDIHDNPGVGLAIRANASPHLAHNVFGGNGASAQAAGSMIFEAAIKPIFTSNVFKGADPQTFTFLDAGARTALKSANWFPDAPKPRPNGRR